MTPSLRRPVEIYREEGVTVLVRKAFRLARERVSDAHWRLRGTRTVTRGGVTATFPTATMDEARALRRLLRLEATMIEDLLSELRSDDVLFDVGAYNGLYTCFAVNALPDGHVVAFEPDPANLEKLRRNLAYNGSPRIREVVLSDEEGTVEFDNPTLARDEWGAKASIAPEAGDDSIVVEARTGDGLVERGELPQPTVVKIDVEGAEALVIEGMADVLVDDRCRLVYCEVHRESEDGSRRSVESYGSTPTGIERTLESIGFVTERLDERPAELFVKGSKEPA